MNMKRLLIIPLLAFGLAGCLTLDPSQKSILQGGPSLTAAVALPATVAKSPYQARLALNLAAKAANSWAKYCWARPYEQLMKDPIAQPVCQNRRPVRRAMFAAGEKADQLIKKATVFVRDNPTISATGLIDDAWAAVNDFRSQIPAVPGS